LAAVPGESVLVAVMLGPTAASKGGEARVRAIDPGAGIAIPPTGAPDGNEEGDDEDASDEFGDTESAEAISIIKQLRQSINATE